MKEEIVHYLVLLLILDLGIASFFLFSFNRYYQGAIVITMGILYVMWGIIHHYFSRDLHLKVILEYILISFLGTLVILSLLTRV